MEEKYRNKIIAAITMVMINAIILTFGFIQYNDYSNARERYTDIQQSNEQKLHNYLYSLIDEKKTSIKSNMESKTTNLQEEIFNTYDDLNSLEYDILNPNENSKLNKLIENQFDYTDPNEPTNHPVIIAGSVDSILWTRTLGDYSYTDKHFLSWDDIISDKYNSVLFKKSIDAVKEVKRDDIVINQIDYSNIKGCTDLDDLLDSLRYTNYNLNELKSFELLVPVYITKDGDIFGNRDTNSLGIKIDNYKIVVLQRINIYDIIKPYTGNINHYIKEINDYNSEIEMVRRDKINVALSIIIFVFAILSVSAMIQKKK